MTFINIIILSLRIWPVDGRQTTTIYSIQTRNAPSSGRFVILISLLSRCTWESVQVDGAALRRICVIEADGSVNGERATRSALYD